VKLTKDAVEKLIRPQDKADYTVWDDELPCFGVRMRGTSKKWDCLYRVNGKQRRESLGDVRKITLEDARKIARQRFAQVELGIDPGAERTKAKVQALLFGAVIDRYLDDRKGLRPRTLENLTRHLKNHWKPLHSLPLSEIKRADVAARVQELSKERGRHAAARARDNLSALYGWAMGEGLCEANPVVATNDPLKGVAARDRVLNDDEIRAIWTACRDDDFGRIVKLLLLSGCRRDEIGGLRWSEINLETGVLTIPGTRTKNHRTLELKLPGTALGILRSQPRRREDYVFGLRGRAFSAWSYNSLRLNARIVEAQGKPLAPWRLHDLRRTMRSNLGRLGVPPHVAELAINHVKGGVQGVYDRHKYQPEIGAALALWATHLLAVVEGRESNVVALHS
jgi:integrase